jgi:hypothetical protein
VWCVEGASIAAIAFVDRSESRAMLPACGLHDLSDRIGVAVDALMAAGNAPPPRAFDDEAAFVKALSDRDFRGAIALAAPSLELDRDGRPCGVAFRTLGHRLGAGYVAGPEGVEHNVAPAVDRDRHRVTFGDDHVHIDHFQRFGLASPLDLEGRYDPKHPAPFGFLRIGYRIDIEGRAQATFAASYLPSCWLYRDGMRVFRQDMREVTASEAERTLLPDRDTAAGTTFCAIDVGRGVVHAARQVGT